MGNTSPKDMDTLLPLMNMVIYSIDKVKKFRLNREVSRESLLAILTGYQFVSLTDWLVISEHFSIAHGTVFLVLKLWYFPLTPSPVPISKVPNQLEYFFGTSIL